MVILDIFDTFHRNMLDTTWLEAIAVLFGLLSVWFAKKENILVFPTGIISVLIYVYICYFAKLYADMGINFFYFVMSIYGWYNWTRKDDRSRFLPISWLTRREIAGSVAAFLFFFIVLSYFLSEFTDSNVPVWDSLTTSLFLVSMWLMALKKIENWIGWIIGDLLSIPLYAYKGLLLTSFQFLVFLLIAVLGFIEWKRRLREHNIKEPA